MAVYQIHSGRLPSTGSWPLAGYPGGVDAVRASRTTVYTTINWTDNESNREPEITSGMANCPEGQVVVLGTGRFKCDSIINIGTDSNRNRKNATLRGTLDASGRLATIIDSRSTSSSINIGEGFSYDYPHVPGDAASWTGFDINVSTLYKGSTQLTVTENTQFANGALVFIYFGNEGTTPTCSVINQPYVRAQIAKIKDSGGIPNINTIVLDDPGINGDHTGLAFAKIVTNENAWVFANRNRAIGWGIENIHLLSTGAVSGPTQGIYLNGCYSCYVYNCKSEGADSYPFALAQSYKCEVNQCWAGGTNGSTSSAGMFIEQSSNCAFTNSVIENSPFGLYQQQKCSSNIFTYNFLINTGIQSVYCNSNHGPWDEFTLYEGNVGGLTQNDGYFGGGGQDTIFRNWWMGWDLSKNYSYGSSAFNRFTRYNNIVGNVMGRSGVGGGDYSFGNPNIGNGISFNSWSRLGTTGYLTANPNSFSGTVTLRAGHGVTAGSVITPYWLAYIGTNPIYPVSRIRYGMTVTHTTATTVSISGGTGWDLPGLNSGIYIPTNNANLVQNSLDWNSGSQTPYLWTGILTERLSNRNGTFRLEPGMSGTFLPALYALAVSSSSGRSLRYTGSADNYTFIVTGLSGNYVSVYMDSESYPLPSSTGTILSISPGHYGFQELDLDVIYTSLLKANYLSSTASGEIPPAEQLYGDTLADSMYLTGAPESFNYYGLAWPPINSSSPRTTTYELIPAGKAYLNGWWLTSGTTGGGGGGGGFTDPIVRNIRIAQMMSLLSRRR